MTDYKKLIERLRTDSAFDFTTLGNEAADAIEALQSECADHKENAIRNARIAVSIRAERDQLQSKLGDAIQSSAHWQHQCTELQSRLDGMGKGEPVGFVAPHDIKTLREGYPATVVMLPSNKRTEPLYAAPKALAPLTDEQKLDIVTNFFTDESDIARAMQMMTDFDQTSPAQGIVGKAMATTACSDFAKEYLAAWDDGMAGDSYLRRMAEEALKCDGIGGTP